MVRKSKKFGPPPYSSLVRSIEDRVLRSTSQLAGSPKRYGMVQNGTEIEKTLEEFNLEWPQMAHNGSRKKQPSQLGYAGPPPWTWEETRENERGTKILPGRKRLCLKRRTSR